MSARELAERFRSPSSYANHEDISIFTQWKQNETWLETQSKQLAGSKEARLAFIGDEDLPNESIITIGNVWTRTASHASSALASIDDGGNRIEEIVPGNDNQPQTSGLRTATLLARLIRNVVADNPKGQTMFFSLVDSALKALWSTTSFALEDIDEAKLLTRALVQMLSNIITDNQDLQEKMWQNHLSLGAESEKTDTKARAPSDLVCRLLDSKDQGTKMAAQILLINMILDSKKRCLDIARNHAGANIMRSLLHDIDTSLEMDEKEEEEEEGEQVKSDGDSGYGVSLQPSVQASQERQRRYEGLGISYTLFTGLFRAGLFDQAYANLQPEQFEGSRIDGSIVSSAQITLLKLQDAYLHSGVQDYDSEMASDLQSIASSFISLANWADQTMQTTLKKGKDAAVDGRLVEVHVALILQLQCLINLAMATETTKKPTFLRVCEGCVEQIRQDDFVIKLLHLMRTTAVFSPPVSPFVPTKASQSAPAPDGHVLSSTGKAHSQSDQDANTSKRPRLDKLKRDLVALLGVIAFKRGPKDEDSVKRVQDLVREEGGLLDVLNLTQLDEHNPYIRERAIFALRNLLQANQASQDLIAQLKPIDPAQQQESQPQ
ncbi:uncharacterized protein FA14DRAFT_12525 [Meira miltonrushii]|uniref:Ataxin-10 homolog n=1 Tax=Meira miltonrushii TaxID=1280837 RepID=A0A316VIB0_9BASI|nr:uncharacterized protein FA14DRAFT_12525 [Meira miltonrushii]PWN37276.1 hypothetical protein FA14DRAFT_12525 [Meira miltonrushii]